MDRGYLDFERLHTLHQASAFFVTRAKSNLAIAARSRYWSKASSAVPEAQSISSGNAACKRSKALELDKRPAKGPAR